MAGPLVSPYAPGPNRMNDAFRIADLIRRQGYSSAETKGQGMQVVGDLVANTGALLQTGLAHREELQKQQELADLLSSGQEFDPHAIIAKYGMETATKAYGLYQAMQPKYENHNPEYDLINPRNGQVIIKGTGRAATGGLTPEEKASVEDIGEAIKAGKASPSLTGMYRMRPHVQAYLAKSGFDLASAETDWKATQRYLQTMNGTPMIRMQSAIYTADHSLDVIADLAEQWDALDKTAWDGQYNLLNRVSLEFAKGGALGQQAQLIAQELDTQINDVSSELGQMYMGGTSPTDYALKMGAENLKGQWSKPTLLGLVKQAKGNIRIRQNSMNLGPAGVGENPYYSPPPPQPIQPPPPYSAPPPGPPHDPTPNTRPVTPMAPPVAPPPVSALIAPPPVAPPGPPPGPPPAAPPAYPFTGGQRQRVEPFVPPAAPPVVPPVVPPQTPAPAANAARNWGTPPRGIVFLVDPSTGDRLDVPVAEVAEALKAGARYPSGSPTVPAAPAAPATVSAPAAPPDTSAPATDSNDSPDPYENAVLMHFKDGRFLYVAPPDEAEVLAGGGRRATGDEIVKVERLGASGVYVGKFNGKKR